MGEAVAPAAVNVSRARVDRALPKPANGFSFGSPRCLRNLRFNMSSKYGTSISILAVFYLGLIPLAAETARSDRHIVVVVWDGMRPDFVTEKKTPTLWKLAGEGVTFRNHHPVYPSATEVNGTALVTGVFPGKSNVIANYAYRPEIHPTRSINVESPTVVSRGDELSVGKYISAPTITEFVQRAGGRTVIATAKTVGLLLDRHAGIGSAKNCVTLFAGKSLARDAISSVTTILRPFPSARPEQDSWTTKALTDVFWKDGLPALSILWLGEPDLMQHESAPGAPSAIAAIKLSDENLAAVLAALNKQAARDTTDLFVVSDHGFSTIRRSIDLRKILSDAGFVAKTEFDEQPKPGDIMLVGNRGQRSLLYRRARHDRNAASGRIFAAIRLRWSDFYETGSARHLPFE